MSLDIQVQMVVQAHAEQSVLLVMREFRAVLDFKDQLV